MEILFLDDLIKRGISKTTIFNEIVKLEKEFFPKYHYNIEDIKKFHELSNGYSLILVYKDSIIGYLIPILFKNKDYLQILTVAVDKKHQKDGYGTKLIKRCENIAKSLELKRVIGRADVSYPIVKILKKLKYRSMQLKDFNENFYETGLGLVGVWKGFWLPLKYLARLAKEERQKLKKEGFLETENGYVHKIINKFNLN